MKHKTKLKRFEINRPIHEFPICKFLNCDNKPIHTPKTTKREK